MPDSTKVNLAVTFLTSIQPPEGNGYYCHWAIKGTNKVQRFLPTITETANEIIRLDDLGATVYHALGTYQTIGKRTHDNIHSLCCLWGDIDVDPNNPNKYPSQKEAYDAGVRFCKEVDIPLFSTVDSGIGLHVYWLLRVILTLEEWLPYALGLKKLAELKGFKLDPTRTADASSILRTPGTYHRKTGTPLLVRWDGKTAQHSLDAFASLLSYSGDTVSAKPFLVNRNTGRTSLSQAVIPYDSPSAEDIADRCNQLFHMRETQGANQSYATWYHSLGLLARCKDGREKAHAWSNGYSTYKPEETDKFFDGYLSHTTGAALCTSFHNANPDLCNRCRYWGHISSPIALTPDRVVEGVDDESEEDDPVINGVEYDFSELPSIKSPFKFLDTGSLVMMTENKKGSSHIEISKFPIYLAGISNTESMGEKEEQHYLFKHFRPKEDWKFINIPAGDYASHKGEQFLRSQGANITDWSNFKKAVVQMVNNHSEESKVGTSYAKFGWKEDGSFLCGSRLYRNGEVEQVRLATTLLQRGSYLKPATGGKLDTWSNVADKMFAKGLEAFGFALLCAAAAPLMRFTSDIEGGAIVHLVSGQSARGKTLALEMLASFYGQWQGLRMTSEDTRISRGLILGTLSHLPVPWDELLYFDPVVITAFVQMFTEGTDRARATRAGELRDSPLSWQTLLVSASNRSLKELMVDQGSTSDAMALRIAEFPFDTDATYGMLQMEEFKNTMLQNAGHAGDAYLKYITRPETIEFIRQALRARMGDLIDTYKFAREYRFYIRTLAAVWVAGEMCQKLGLMDFDPKRIVEWAIGHLKEKPKALPDLGYRSPAFNLLTRFLNENIRGTLVVPNAQVTSEPILKPMNELIIRKEQREHMIYISVKAFAKWLINGNNSVRDVSAELIRAGIFQAFQPYTNLGYGTQYGGTREDTWAVKTNTMVFSGVGEEPKKTNVVRLKK